ncbi:DinB family protein [Amphritea sp.]|uniref:DinB family protein n=1 Tax=Amphritea sp. TaxID=1872502 RepID=UPI003D0CEA54
MDIREHFILMADYNIRMNGQIYSACSGLSTEKLSADRGAFFGSLLGALNHLVVGDLLWLARFSAHSQRYHSLSKLSALPTPTSLDEILYADLASLVSVRTTLDRLIRQWLSEEVSADDFNRPLVYANSKGVVSERDFGELVCHFFNHQIHHRGQITTLLSQENIDVGVTDFLIDIPDHFQHSS